MTPESMLAQFDEAAERFVFPMLDNGYVYPADVRLTVYRSNSDWLMIIQALGAYSPRTSGCDSFQNCLHLFGSRLHRQSGTANEDFLHPIESLADHPLFVDEDEWTLRPGASELGIRGRRIAFDARPTALEVKGIELIQPPEIDPPAVLRSLLPEHRDILLASEEELNTRNPLGLSKWLQLETWHHPNLSDGELPSQNETFILLAKCIATGDRSIYQPTLPPNTHWRHWPEGGTL